MRAVLCRRREIAPSLSTKDHILAAARKLQGLERLEQIQYAVVEESDSISIIPKRDVASSLGLLMKNVRAWEPERKGGAVLRDTLGGQAPMHRFNQRSADR